MALPTDDDLAPVARGLARGARAVFGRLVQRGPEEARPLSPMDVDECAWREVRRNTRAWPDYTEAPNGVVVHVSQEDWKDYWGVCQDRKGASVAAYLLRRASERGLWIAGRPQVSFVEDEALQRGSVRAESAFVDVPHRAAPAAQTEPESIAGDDFLPAREYASGRVSLDTDATQPAMGLTRVMGQPGDTAAAGATSSLHVQTAEVPAGGTLEMEALDPEVEVPAGSELDATVWADPFAEDAEDAASAADETRVMRPEDIASQLEEDQGEAAADSPLSDEAWLVGSRGFRMLVRPGDVIGAVDDNGPVPEDVNIRLDARYFHGVEAKQMRLDRQDGQWMLTNLAKGGTSLGSTTGGRALVVDSEPRPLHDGDVITMGEDRPLRFEAQD